MFKGCGSKIVGYCSHCDTQIFEILAQFSHDHPYAGRPTRIGKPFEMAWQVDLVLMNGHHVQISMCETCVSLYKKTAKWSALWGKLLKGWEQEQDAGYRLCVGLKQLSEQQQYLQRHWLESMIDERPVGMLAAQKIKVK